MARLNREFVTAVVITAALILNSGCSATLDKSALQATEGSPESTASEVVAIPHDPKLPTYVVAVQPFIFSRALGPNQAQITITTGGESLAAKLTTALANVGNFSVVDSDALQKAKSGKYGAKLQKGEVGPFIVKATVTEFTEVAEASSESSGASLGWLGLVGGIAGAVSGNRALGWTGAGLAAANPSYQSDNREKKGMVAIDFQVIDGRTSRLVGAFKASGTFSSASATKGFSIFGIGKESHKFAQSVLNQAVRVAINDAVKKMNDCLTAKVKA